MKFKLFLICLILKFHSSLGFSSGAGTTSCDNLTPNHGHEQQTTQVPVVLTLSTQNLRQGETMTITIDGQDDFAFRGFMIQARTVTEDPRVVGEFQVFEGIRHVNCINHPQNSVVTHSSSALKSRLILTWRAQTDFDGLINFHFTILENFSTFWVNQRSQFVLISPGEVEQPPETTTEETDTEETTIEDTTPGDTTPETTPETTTAFPGSEVYDGCDTRKLCFGFPEPCLRTRNCELFGAVIHDENDKFFFEMLSHPGESYIAMALSNDSRMGLDSAIECVRNNNAVQAFASFTIVDNTGFFARRELVEQEIVDLDTYRIIDNRIYCLVERDDFNVIESAGMEFDLRNVKHYLLMASGPRVEPTTILDHFERHGATSRAYNLTNPGIVRLENSRRILVSVHGALMIVAWIGLTSIGIVISRYFKKTFDQKICNVDAWFFWHVFGMVLTWILTIAGFIIIFVDVGQWRTSVHAILGTITTVLVFFQPIGGILRPSLTSSRRPVFNFLHFASGNIAHVLAVLTIFFSVGLIASNIPDWTTYILVAFVVYYLIMHIVFTTIKICGDVKRDKKVGSSKRQPYGLLFKTLFGFFVLTVLMFVIALVLIVTLPPF